MKLEMKHIHTGGVIQVELGDNSFTARKSIEDAEWLNYRADPKEMMDALRSIDKLNIGEDVPEFEPTAGMREVFGDDGMTDLTKDLDND
tara:strand:+ start:972 stop:1238 length:267 start_codon:yes stop_codon:yes gene_type:complete